MIKKICSTKRIFIFLIILSIGLKNISAKPAVGDKKTVQGTQRQQPTIPIPTNFENFQLDLTDPITSLRNARDSYGNPLPSAGDKNGNRKVIEANGYLFEIPSYASGITDIKPPSDELLPPLVSEEEKDDKTENTPTQYDEPFLDLLPPFPGEQNDSNVSKDDSTVNEIKNTQSPKIASQTTPKVSEADETINDSGSNKTKSLEPITESNDVTTLDTIDTNTQFASYNTTDVEEVETTTSDTKFLIPSTTTTDLTFTNNPPQAQSLNLAQLQTQEPPTSIDDTSLIQNIPELTTDLLPPHIDPNPISYNENTQTSTTSTSITNSPLPDIPKLIIDLVPPFTDTPSLSSTSQTLSSSEIEISTSPSPSTAFAEDTKEITTLPNNTPHKEPVELAERFNVNDEENLRKSLNNDATQTIAAEALVTETPVTQSIRPDIDDGIQISPPQFVHDTSPVRNIGDLNKFRPQFLPIQSLDCNSNPSACIRGSRSQRPVTYNPQTSSSNCTPEKGCNINSNSSKHITPNPQPTTECNKKYGCSNINVPSPQQSTTFYSAIPKQIKIESVTNDGPVFVIKTQINCDSQRGCVTSSNVPAGNIDIPSLLRSLNFPVPDEQAIQAQHENIHKNIFQTLSCASNPSNPGCNSLGINRNLQSPIISDCPPGQKCQISTNFQIHSSTNDPIVQGNHNINSFGQFPSFSSTLQQQQQPSININFDPAKSLVKPIQLPSCGSGKICTHIGPALSEDNIKVLLFDVPAVNSFEDSFKQNVFLKKIPLFAQSNVNIPKENHPEISSSVPKNLHQDVSTTTTAQISCKNPYLCKFLLVNNNGQQNSKSPVENEGYVVLTNEGDSTQEVTTKGLDNTSSSTTENLQQSTISSTTEPSKKSDVDVQEAATTINKMKCDNSNGCNEKNVHEKLSCDDLNECNEQISEKPNTQLNPENTKEQNEKTPDYNQSEENQQQPLQDDSIPRFPDNNPIISYFPQNPLNNAPVFPTQVNQQKIPIIRFEDFLKGPATTNKCGDQQECVQFEFSSEPTDSSEFIPSPSLPHAHFNTLNHDTLLPSSELPASHNTQNTDIPSIECDFSQEGCNNTSANTNYNSPIETSDLENSNNPKSDTPIKFNLNTGFNIQTLPLIPPLQQNYQPTKEYSSISFAPGKTSPTYGEQPALFNSNFPNKQPNYQQQPQIPVKPSYTTQQIQPDKAYSTAPFNTRPSSKQPLPAYQGQPTTLPPGLQSNYPSTAQPTTNYQQSNPLSKQKPPIRFEDFLKGPLSAQKCNNPQGCVQLSSSLPPNRPLSQTQNPLASRFGGPLPQQTIPNNFKSPNSLTSQSLQAPKDNGDLTYFLWFVKNKDQILNNHSSAAATAITISYGG